MKTADAETADAVKVVDAAEAAEAEAEKKIKN